MEDRVNQFADKVEKALEPVKQLFYDISIGDWFAVGEDTSNIVSGIFNFFSDAIAKVDWQGVGNNIGLFLAGINWTEVFISIGKLLWEAINAVIDLLDGSFDAAPIEMAIISGIALLKWTGLGTIIFTGIKNAIKSKLSNIAEIFTEGGFLTNIGLVFENLFSGLSLKESMIAVFGELGTKIAGIGTVISGLILSVTNFIDMLNDGFSWFNEILMLVGIGLTTVGAIILGAPATVAAVVSGIVAAVATLVIVIKDNWDSIAEWTSELFKKVSEFFSDLWEKIKGIWSTVSNWFNQYVIEPISSFFEGFYTRVSQIFDGLWITIKAIWIIVSTWFNDSVVKPIINFFSPIVAKISGFFNNLWSNIKSAWGNVSNWFNTNIINPVTNAFNTACDKIESLFSSLWNGIKKGVIGAMNGVIGGIETGINTIISGINKIIKGFNKVVSWASKVAEVNWGGVDLVSTVSLSRIPTYQTGGFPEDGWFRASKGEYFGKFDDGTSVIANNNQIISGIANGVRDANTEQNTLLREQNELLRQILAKDMGISSRDIFNTVRNEDNSYKRRNGHSAFAY